VGEPVTLGDMRVVREIDGDILDDLDIEDERVDVPDTDRDLEEVMESEEVRLLKEERDAAILRVPVAHARLDAETEVVDVGDFDCVTVFVWIAEDVEVFVVVGQGVPFADAVAVREDVEEAVAVTVIRAVRDPFTLTLALGLAELVREVLMDFVTDGEAEEVRDCLVDALPVADAVIVLDVVIEDVAVFDDVPVRVEELEEVEVRVVVADLETEVDDV
jgi:hypothetical protein